MTERLFSDLAGRRARGLLAVTALAIAILLGPAAWTARGENGTVIVNPHDFRDKTMCGACHRGSTPLLIFDPVTTCVKCHHGNIENHPVAKHPLGTVPRIKLPPTLPLSPQGQIVCYTCHAPHGSKHPMMLRVEYLRLCVLCHAGY
ncbi:MAG: cytochrome c3 family protein [Deltaproteobacteria bacterium]|nr:cytochrome c3 family protein [Deltaproteobacteria bacterium]